MTAPGSRASADAQEPTVVLPGRDREQASLREEFNLASAGAGRLCLIGGEAGIGKTTLARDLASTAVRRGAHALTGSCYDRASRPPYGPWLDLFETCERDPDLPSAPTALAGGQLAAIPDQAALFADVRRFLAALAERPALIVLEDCHWADPASLDLLRHIGPHLRHWPMHLVLTYRSDELAAETGFARHLPALVREADAARLDLHRLDVDDLRALVNSQCRLLRADEDRLCDYLMAHAEGNPFFATEILRTLEVEGVLCPGEERWSLGPLDRIVVPPLLRQVIDGRVSRLGMATRKALAIAAVIGHEVPLDLWTTVGEVPEDTLLDIVDEAVAAHLLEAEWAGTRVRFVHALTREALYEGILPPRRRAWHLRVAEALLAQSPVDAEAIAVHLQRAGDPRAVEWLARAGERAQRAYAWLTAAERFQAAADLLEHTDGGEAARTRRLLLMRRGNLLRFANPVDAIAALAEARELARQAGDAFLVAEAESLLGIHYGYADRFRAGLASMEHGIAAIEAMPFTVQQSTNSIRSWLTWAVTGNEELGPADDTAALDLLRANGVDFRRCFYCWHLATSGRLATATAVQQQLAGMLSSVVDRRSGIDTLAAWARYGMAVIAAARGQPDDASQHWATARTHFGSHHMLVAFTLLGELRDVALPFFAADPQKRRTLSDESETVLARGGAALRPGVSPKLAWLRCLVIDGRWDEAQAILDDLPDPGNCFLRRERTCASAVLARYRGEPEIAWAEIRALLPQGPATEPGDIIHQEGLFLLRLAADLELDAGDPGSAVPWLEAHDRWLAWSGSVLGRAEGRLAWGRYHHAAGDTATARTCVEDALSLATDPGQPLVQLGAHRLLGEIHSAENNPDGAEDHLTAALALADACETSFERALTLVALVLHLARTGDRTEAETLVEETREILTVLGAAPALAAVATVATRLGVAPASPPNARGLTPRELEVLRLIAAGYSNPAIAEHLFISRETARTHVSSILRKLDVSTRTEAVDRAHRVNLLGDTGSAGGPA